LERRKFFLFVFKLHPSSFDGSYRHRFTDSTKFLGTLMEMWSGWGMFRDFVSKHSFDVVDGVRTN